MMQNYGEEPQAKLKEAVEIVKRLDARFASFIGGECDDDILDSFHLDVFTFGLFALDEGFPLAAEFAAMSFNCSPLLLGSRMARGCMSKLSMCLALQDGRSTRKRYRLRSLL